MKRIIAILLLSATAAHAQVWTSTNEIGGVVSPLLYTNFAQGSFRVTLFALDGGSPADLADSTIKLQVTDSRDGKLVVSNTASRIDASTYRGEGTLTASPNSYAIKLVAYPAEGDPYDIYWADATVSAQASSSVSLSLVPLVASNGAVGTADYPWSELHAENGYFANLAVSNLDVAGAINTLDTGAVRRVGDTWQGPMTGEYANTFNLSASSNYPAERLTGSELPALSGRLLTGIPYGSITDAPSIGAAAQYITTNTWGQVGWTNQISGEFAPFDGLWPTYTPTWVQRYGSGATINSANLGAWDVGQSNGFAYAKWSALEAVNQARILDYYTLPDSNGAWRAAYQIVEPPMGDGGGRYIFGLGFARAAVTQEIYALCLQKSSDTTIPWSAKWVTFTNAGSAQAVFAGSVYGTVAAGGTIDTFMQYRWRPERGNWLLIDKPAASAVFRMGFGRGNENRITPLPYLIGASTNVPAVASHVVVVAQSSTGASVTNTLMLAWRSLMVETNALWW